jgi:rhamnulokinase
MAGSEVAGPTAGTPRASFAAVDLGADSGRVIEGALWDDRLTLTEIHRFPNVPVAVPEGLRWDVLRLWSEISTGLQRAAHRRNSDGSELRAVGIDTWGVDFALLDRHGMLIGNPAHYRDDRTDGMLEEACRVLSRERIYRTTGTQLLPINTIYQLLSLVRRNSAQLDAADRLLMMPDLFNVWLSGCAATELSIATTTQCLDVESRAWAAPLLVDLGIPARIFGEIVPAGRVLGHVAGSLGRDAGLERVAVVATGSHDTASAAAAVPASGRDFAWLSSGTWSVMGIESPAPIVTDVTMRRDLSNEAGVAGRWLLLRTMPGMWLLQECRREWAREGEELSYADLERLAETASPFASIVDPEAAALQRPGDMPTLIREFCRSTGQPEPESRGAVVRCALESLALQYGQVLDWLEEAAGHKLSSIHIVGGGSQGRLLCQMTADATSRPCVAGPIEATAVGNILVQAIALGHLAGLDEGREIVRRSLPLRTYEPGAASGLDEAKARFLELTDARRRIVA